MKLLMTMIVLSTMMYAADYGHMSTEEMMQMRGNVPAEQQADFRAEMQKRMQSMTPEERRQYRNERPGMGQHMMDAPMRDQQMQNRPGMQEMPSECRKYTMGDQGMMDNRQQGMQENQHMMGSQAMRNIPEQCRRYMNDGQGMMMEHRGMGM